MGSATGDNERAESQEHPVKRYVASSFASQISKCSGDSEIGQANAGISNHMSPHQSRLAQVAVKMRQEIRRQNVTGKSRPDQKGGCGNRQQQGHPVKQLAGGEWGRFK